MEGSEAVVERQLNRKVTNLKSVIRYCSFGYPVVVESYPVKDGEPFPTLYWLTCPFLRKEVAKLEEKGWIKRFEKMIEEDPVFKEKLEKAHEVVKKRRDALIKDENIRRALEGVGSGGIRDISHVKCLHLHLADYLAGVDNPVGEQVWLLIGVKECDGGRVCEDLVRSENEI